MQSLINVQIARVGAQIDKPLPAILFCANDYYSGYQLALKNLVPLGVSSAGAINTIDNEVSKSFIRFLFTETIFANVNEVRANEIPMATLNANSISNPFTIKQLDITTSNNAFLSEQFRQPVSIIKTGLFGKKIADTFTPSQYLNDMIKLNDYVSIPLDLKIDGNIGLSFNVLPINNFKLFLSLTIEY
jgi:hypothetical protein